MRGWDWVYSMPLLFQGLERGMTGMRGWDWT
jgi:hypothetical protein